LMRSICCTCIREGLYLAFWRNQLAEESSTSTELPEKEGQFEGKQVCYQLQYLLTIAGLRLSSKTFNSSTYF
jgi:hypothetical protein